MYTNWPCTLLLQTHDQAVDPNLVRLAEAYDIAAKQMTSLTDEASVHEEAENQTVLAES